VIDLAHALGLVVVGEGVETAEQRAFLETHGCDRMQGYLLGRPAPAEEIGAWLAAAGAGAPR
jgi:EAL domain-containing protein (putative c-di-GMP-specific phosphodiesterase class I)